jgi:uncharacterized repeat protein (TIGR01451 family)
MKSLKTNQAMLGIACAVCLVCAPVAQEAQAQGQASSSSPTSSASVSSGGTAPIETTLFAYRALASDAQAVAKHIAAIHGQNRVIIGTASDVAAFTQWRAVMAQAALLDGRAQQISTKLQSTAYTDATPLPFLRANIARSGSVVKGQTITYTVTVSNDPSASPTSSPVIVTEALTGATISTMTGTGWSCSVGAGTCTFSSIMAAGASYAVTVAAKVTGDPQSSVVNQVIVTGGGASVSASATDTATISAAPSGGLHFLMTEPNTLTTPTTTTPTTTPPATPASLFSTATGAIPSLVQAGQFLAQAFAVNQNLTSSQGSMTDAPLINLVAERLRRHGVFVYVPSVYPANLLRNGNLTDTYLWTELQILEGHRIQLWTDVADGTAKMNKANFVTQNPTRYSALDLQNALTYFANLQSLITSGLAVATSIDSFEASLLGGQAPAQSATGATGVSPTSGASGATGSTGASGGTGATSATGLTATAAASTPSASSSSSSPSASTLPQILASDLLAQRLWGGAVGWVPNGKDLPTSWNSVNFLTVHSLESGGSVRITSNIFFGNHIFFSGGAVMTFSLFAAEGDVRCSGVAYTYSGNVREKNYEENLRGLAPVPALEYGGPACQ